MKHSEDEIEANSEFMENDPLHKLPPAVLSSTNMPPPYCAELSLISRTAHIP